VSPRVATIFAAALPPVEAPPVDLRDLLAQLWIRASGNMEQILEWLKEIMERYPLLGEGKGYEDMLAELEKMGLIRQEGDKFVGTPAGSRSVRDSVYERLFQGLSRGLAGRHAAPTLGPGTERVPSTRPWSPGDDPRDIDWNASLVRTALRGGEVSSLSEDDLSTWETEAATSCATALLIDVSHSMILYGEDRITPAKMLAIGLSEHIRRNHPRDTLDVVAFGDEAWRIPNDSIAELSVGPFHTNTADGLRLARDLLRRRRAPNRRILVVTDGKPSCVFDKGRLYKNPFGLDPLVVERTLAEGRRCRRDGSLISTFLIAQDPMLVAFAELFARAVDGQVFQAGLDRLGEVVLSEWSKSRIRTPRRRGI